MAALRVLIVDDLEAMRQQFVSLCREYIPDSEIHEAADVMEAMEMLRRVEPPFHAIFTDVNMPNVSGLKLIPLIRNLKPYRKTPLIVLSTLTGRTDISRALQLGANAYLTRPFQKEYFEIVFLAYLNPIIQTRAR